MKRIICLVLLTFLAIPLMAQHHGPRPDKKARPEISEVVGDLTPMQKRRVEKISRESRERVDALRARKQAVCDSILLLMEREGDQSRLLFPLFEREARLQTAINREMYTTKLRIDEVLTREQCATLRDACKKERSHPRR